MKSRLKNSVALLLLCAASPAIAQADRSVLPIPEQPFAGVIRDSVTESTPDTLYKVQAPAGAPNIFVFMSDDVGFSMSSTFGGPVPTPNIDRLARVGQRYNRFHTTGICSPSRAALLTGRNHHNAATGHLVEFQSGYPGYAGRFPASTATIAQTLKLNGYNTAMFGKHHNVPSSERSAAGPFDMWPTGLGFEHFFGFNVGAVDQYRPNIYRDTTLLDQPGVKPELLEKRMADDAIDWIHNQKAAAPDKPFFIYYAPGSTHVPHQAPADYIARFRGQFDQGWDRLREETFRRQLTAGVIPKGTKLTSRPEGITAWSSLTDKQKRWASRTMEVGAGMLAYQDAQLGRLFDELERMGIFDDTLFVFILGDNGAAAESGNDGILSMGQPLPHDKDGDWPAEILDNLGNETNRPGYGAGWAWALNTPLQWVKQYASMLGGIRNGMVMAWPAKHPARSRGFCAQFGHLVDVAPTVFEAAGVPAPHTVFGTKQKPLDGQSLLSSLDNCRPDNPRTQYFEINGKLGLYHDGWFAGRENGRLTWERSPPGGDVPQTTWALYDLRSDFSQSTDLSKRNPAKMAEMIALWDSEAKRNNVYPINHIFGAAPGNAAIGALSRTSPPSHSTLAPPLVFWGKNVSVPGSMLRSQSFDMTADLRLDRADASGVVTAAGGRFGGWSLSLDKGHPTFAYAMSPLPEDNWRIVSTEKVPQGASQLHLSLKIAPLGGPGKVQVRDGTGKILLTGELPRTFGTSSYDEMLDIGRDTGVPVTRYSNGIGNIEGDIPKVTFTFEP